MDLKHMLNESHAHRPGGPPHIQTTPSSYDARSEPTPNTADVTSARPTPYPGPSSSLDARAPGGAPGSYFAVQSPHHNTSASSSTPSAGPYSAYTQSPGSYVQPYTPRDGNPPPYPSNASLVSPSPSSSHLPPTPGSAHPSAHASYPYIAPNQSYSQYQSPPPPQANGLPPGSARRFSPNSHHQPHPATPLGPPIGYPKVSPQAHRPASRGHEQYLHRRASHSSVGSAQSREYTQPSIPPPAEQPRHDSIARSYSHDLRDRERSISVSPKTIPKPSPYREMSVSSQGASFGRPSPDAHGRSSSHMAVPRRESTYHLMDNPTPPSSYHQPSMPPSNPSSYSDQPPRPPPPAINAQEQLHLKREEGISQYPVVKPDPSVQDNTLAAAAPPSLKRRASQLSQSSARIQPPPKKPRRLDFPLWAQCARKKPPHFIPAKARSHTQNQQRQQQQQQQQPQTQPSQTPQTSQPLQPHVNGHQHAARQSMAPEQQLENEATIADIIPFEDLTRRVCNWIARTIGLVDPPQDSVFEIEGKVGAIVLADAEDRVTLPILSEAIFNRDAYGARTKFISSMNPLQHQKLNEYLNGLVQQREEQLRHGMIKHRIHYAHPRENDHFFELTDEGRNNIPPSVRNWIFKNPHRKDIKVRRTIDRETGQQSRTIIKTRIEDMDVVSPRTEFDFRISLSIESDCTEWLNDAWLKPVTYGRNKDRLSYRHMMYQIDLTQVSYDDSTDKEHELEVEIATPVVRQELEKVKAGQPSNYENMVRGLIDNVRLLCRKGSLCET